MTVYHVEHIRHDGTVSMSLRASLISALGQASVDLETAKPGEPVRITKVEYKNEKEIQKDA